MVDAAKIVADSRKIVGDAAKYMADTAKIVADAAKIMADVRKKVRGIRKNLPAPGENARRGWHCEGDGRASVALSPIGDAQVLLFCLRA